MIPGATFISELKRAGLHWTGSMKRFALPMFAGNLGIAALSFRGEHVFWFAWACVGVGGSGMLAWVHFLED